MICSKCGTQIPENAGFCPACGGKALTETRCPACGLLLESGTKICPVCRAPVSGSADIADTPVTPTAPISVSLTKEESGSDGRTSPETAESASDTAFTFPGQPSAKAAQSPFGAAFSSAADISSGFADASSFAVTPVKKKKLWPFFVFIPVGVIVIAAAVLFFTQRPLIFRTFMGDGEYAAMLEKDITKGVSFLADSPAFAAGINASAKTAASVWTSLSTANAHGGAAPETDISAVVASVYDSLTGTSGKNGVKYTADVTLELTDSAKSLLASNFGESADIIDKINALSAEMTAFAQPDRFSAELALISGNGFMIDSRITALSDGSVGIMFPFASERCVKYTVSGGTSSPDAPADIPPEELKRLVNELSGLYLDYFRQGTVTVNSGRYLEVAGKQPEGTLVVTKLDGVLLNSLYTDIIDLLTGDEYFSGLIADHLSSSGRRYSAQEMRRALSGQPFSLSDALVVKTLVNAQNKPLAKSYSFERNSKSALEIAFTTNNKAPAFGVLSDDQYIFAANITPTAGNSGSAALKYYTGGRFTLGYKIDYEDISLADHSGGKVFTGSVRVSPLSSVEAESDTPTIAQAASGIYFGLSASADGDVYTITPEYNMPQYGRISVTIKAQPINGEVPDIPAWAVDINGGGITMAEQEDNAAYIRAMADDILKALNGADAAGFPFINEIRSAVGKASADIVRLINPAADENDVDQLIDRITGLMNRADSVEDRYRQVLTDEIYDELTELRSALRALRKTLTSGSVPKSDYEDALQKCGEYDDELTVISDRLEELYKKANSVDYSTISVDGLLEVYSSLNARLGMLMDTYPDEIGGNREIYDQCNEAADLSLEIISDLYDYIYGDVNISAADFRKIKKKVQNFEQLVADIEAALSSGGIL